MKMSLKFAIAASVTWIAFLAIGHEQGFMELDWYEHHRFENYYSLLTIPLSGFAVIWINYFLFRKSVDKE